jgi:hypothetical protein
MVSISEPHTYAQLLVIVHMCVALEYHPKMIQLLFVQSILTCNFSDVNHQHFYNITFKYAAFSPSVLHFSAVVLFSTYSERDAITISSTQSLQIKIP